MSDAMSQAKKDREHAEDWLRSHGWEKVSVLSWWQDPLDPGGEPLRLDSALRRQEERDEGVREGMEA